MIKLINIAPNCCAIKATQEGGFVEIYYSYNTPVAVCFINSASLERYRAQPSSSATTTKHLKKMGVYDWSPMSLDRLKDIANNIELHFSE